MAFVRIYGSSLTTGTPYAAIIADKDDPTKRTVVGGPSVEGMVDHRWTMYLEKGLPPDHRTLLTTLSGSHVTVTDWEDVGDDLKAAVAEAEEVLEKREPLPGVLISP